MAVSDIMQDAAAWRAFVSKLLELQHGDILTARAVGIEFKMMLPSTLEALEDQANGKE